ncbi:MAG: hypothetical protein KME13_15090 [Myxacorys californica WJT36-NPBG1]|jgi:hypothetical protein|nr:hypothetical protein [Myxacorys californica WJT36-NPBG1]
MTTNPYRCANQATRKFALTEMPRISLNPISRNPNSINAFAISIRTGLALQNWSAKPVPVLLNPCRFKVGH